MDIAIKTALYEHFPDIDKNSQQRFWLDRYIRFIENCQKKDWTQTDEYFETHHIVPSSWGGTNDKANLIKFPYRAHVIAHHLLSRTQDRQMGIAFHRILTHFPEQTFRFINARLIAESRNQMAIAKAHSIINLHTGEITSTTELARKYNCSTAIIVGCIINVTKFKGHYWKFTEDVEDYHTALETLLKQKAEMKERHKQIIGVANGRPVVNLNTGETFDNAIQAIIAYGRSLRNRGAIYKAINGGYKFADCFWQFKDIVDQSSIEIELQKYYDNSKQKQQSVITNRYKPVINITTGEEFPAMKFAAEAYSTTSSGIRIAIRAKQRCAGCYWMWKNEEDQQKAELQHPLELERQRKNRQGISVKQKNSVVCIETGQVFDSPTLAAKFCGLKYSSCIHQALTTGRTAGGFHWCTLKEIKQSQQTIEQFLENKRAYLSRDKHRPVVNLNTGEIYPSGAAVIKKYYGENTSGTFSSFMNAGCKIRNYYFQYLDIVQQSSIEEELHKCEQRALLNHEQHRRRGMKPIINLTTGERFESVAAAAQTYNAKVDSDVSAAAKTKQPFANCFWIFEKDLKEDREVVLARYIAEYNETHPQTPIKG